jgi:trimeric autotransporter adhesin
MSKEAITKVVQRAISDAGFRRQLSTDPTGALRGFDLSADETAALRSGDVGRLSALGVDQRMSKAFALGGASVGATRMAGSDLSHAASALVSDVSTGGVADARGNALVAGSTSDSDSLISDGSSARTIIPADPNVQNADTDAAAGIASNAINDDPDGFLAASANRASAGESGAATSAINDDPDGFLAASQARAVGDPGPNYPAHNGLAGPSELNAVRAGDDWARTGGQTQDAGGSVARGSAINDDPDGFLAANAKADVSGSAGETAFIDDSEGYLTSVGYDADATTSAVTDAHDRGEGAAVSEVSDAHDRTDITRISVDDDAGGTSAASEDGPNISA